MPTTPKETAAQGDIESCLADLAMSYQTQLQLCDQLEVVADSLPGNVNREHCVEIARKMDGIFQAAHEIEEGIVFPWLLRHADGQQFTRETIERLRSEHCLDQDACHEVRELLTRLSQGNNHLDMNGAGYMLRSFFETVRRHVWFDLEHVLPLANHFLENGDGQQMHSKDKMTVRPTQLASHTGSKKRTIH